MNGIFNIDKPYGISSMDVIRQIRNATNISKVGHGGTLDPLASGVIPVAIGNSTRLLEYILNNNKKYLAEITLGVSTNTYDREGEITKQADTSHINQQDIEELLKNFTGEMSQIPPMYSAIKSNGKKLYSLARKGINVERPPRTTIVYSILLKSYDNPIMKIEISCSKGFYVRSLANEIGELLNCGAHLTNLRRTASGSFSISQSNKLSTVIEKILCGDTKDILLDPTDYLENIDQIYLSENETNLVKTGRRIKLSPQYSLKNINMALGFNADKSFLAILAPDYKTSEWYPKKVFPNWSE